MCSSDLIGHRNHPEVIGTMGQTDKKIHLVEKVEDVKKYKKLKANNNGMLIIKISLRLLNRSTKNPDNINVSIDTIE